MSIQILDQHDIRALSAAHPLHKVIMQCAVTAVISGFIYDVLEYHKVNITGKHWVFTHQTLPTILLMILRLSLVDESWFCNLCSTSGDYCYSVESTQQRQQRLGKRKQHEPTPEEREQHLATRRLKRTSETSQQRDERLASQRQLRQEETPDQRDQRLASQRQLRQEETPDQRDQRLASRRQIRQEETPDQRDQRLASQRQTRQEETREGYLHQGNWQSSGPLEDQKWAQQSMAKFHRKQEQWQHRQCTICNEQWPVRTRLNIQPYICLRCQRDKTVPKVYSADNDMDPGKLPACLEGMTQVEEMLIARACPIMTVYRKHGGQRGYSGHVLNLPQSIEQFLSALPPHVSELPLLSIKRTGSNNSEAYFKVHRDKVLNALLWLKHNNRFYHDIVINYDNISLLPADGIPDDIRTLPAGTDSEISTEDSDDVASTSFIPQPQNLQREEDAIRSAVDGQDSLDWPSLGKSYSKLVILDTQIILYSIIGNTPLNEFQTEGLATQAFPTLFPYGKGDPTCKGRHHSVTLADAFKHLMKYCDRSPDGTARWRFASHPRFPYWALNMKQRHTLLSQSRIYMQQNTSDANLTIDELKTMVGGMSSVQLMKRLNRYAAKTQGSRQYWYSRHQDLKALLEQKGSPTFFFTFSSADNYWPELHTLMPHQANNIHSTRVQSVITNPQLASSSSFKPIAAAITNLQRPGSFLSLAQPCAWVLPLAWYSYLNQYHSASSV